MQQAAPAKDAVVYEGISTDFGSLVPELQALTSDMEAPLDDTEEHQLTRLLAITRGIFVPHPPEGVGTC